MIDVVKKFGVDNYTSLHVTSSLGEVDIEEG